MVHRCCTVVVSSCRVHLSVKTSATPIVSYKCLTKLPAFKREEGGDDVKSAWLLQLGRHTCYNGKVQRDAKAQAGANPTKTSPSSDRGLQLALVKPESLVTVDQPRHGEYVLRFCTHRPSSHGSGKRMKCPFSRTPIRSS